MSYVDVLPNMDVGGEVLAAAAVGGSVGPLVGASTTASTSHAVSPTCPKSVNVSGVERGPRMNAGSVPEAVDSASA